MTVMGAADVPGSCCAKAAGPPLAAAARPAPIALTISRRDGDMDGPSAISAKAYQVAAGAAMPVAGVQMDEGLSRRQARRKRASRLAASRLTACGGTRPATSSATCLTV